MADKTSLIKITVDVEKGILEIGNLKMSLNDSNAAAQGLNDTLNQQTKVVDGSAAAIRRKIAAAKAERDMTASNNAEYVKQTQIVNKLEAELLELTHTQHNVSNVSLKTGKSLATMQKNLGSVDSAAGLAGASVMETGRLISDLPYGIQGAANNLSQLGSMFGMLVAQAGKMNNGLSTSRNVINLLSAQFFGPLGIIVAFQAAVAAIEFFTKKQGEAKREADKLTKGIEDQNKALREQQTLLTNLGSAVLGDEAATVLGKQLREVETFLEAAASYGEVSQTVVDFAVENGKNIIQARQEQNKFTTELIDFEQKLSEHGKKTYEELGISKNKYDKITEELNYKVASSTTALIEAINKEEQALANLNLEKQEEILLNQEIKNLKEEDEISEEIERPSFADDILAATSDASTLYKDQLEEMGMSEENFISERERRAARNLRNQERDARRELRIQQQVAAAKAKIQQTQANNAVQGFKLLGAIAKEGSKLQALALIGENAAGIAKTIISTKAANAAVRLKYAAIPGGALLAKKQVIANNISAAIGVAAQVAATQKALAAMKATESAASAPRIGGDDGGQEPQQPDFNIVGASQLNQLATTIAEQEEQPVRAYVVASDVSTAQELDRNILSEASIG